MKTLKRKLRRRRSGQGMTEYIIIVGLIAILLITAVTKFKDALNNAWSKGADEIENKIANEIGKPE